MTNLTASPALTPVPQLETTTVALGGAGAIMNAQAQALLNQVAYMLVMTTIGDLTTGGTSGAPTRLAIGSGGMVLTVVAGAPAWQAPAVASVFGRTGAIVAVANDYTFAQIGSKPTTVAGYGITDALANPMTAAGDIIAGGTSGVPQRLAKGTDGQVLTLASGTPAWQNSASGFTNPMTAVGDIIIGGTAGAAQRLAAATNTWVLTLVAGAPAWAAAPSAAVASVFGRTGAVVAAANDYTFAQLASKPTTVAGYGITDAVQLNNASQWTSNQSVAPSTLTFAATVTPAAGGTNNFNLTLTGACTLANPTGLVAGMVLNFCIDQDATGGRVLTLGSLFKWPGGTVPTWVTTASAKNFFSAYYDGTILRCNGAAGYA